MICKFKSSLNRLI